MMNLLNIMKKNMNKYIIIYLDFEFDILKMEIHLSINKKFHILQVTQILLEINIISVISFDEILNFLSHYY